MEEEDDNATITPEEAKFMIKKTLSDKSGAYFNLDDKFTKEHQDLEIARVFRYRLIAAGKETSLTGFMEAFEAGQEDLLKAQYDNSDPHGKNRSSSYGQRTPTSADNSNPDIGYGEKPVSGKFGTYRIEDGNRVLDVDPQDDAGVL